MEVPVFFVISKVLGPLLQPLPLFFLFGLVVLVRVQAGWWRRSFVVALAALWLCSAPLVSNLLARWWEGRFPPVAAEDLPDADAVVVLAGMLNPSPAHGRADRLEWNDAVDRALEGAALVREGRASWLVLSGGSGRLLERGALEAPLLAEWMAETLALPRERLLVEADSRTTSEGARAVARLAQERGWERVILVTSARHMERAASCFAKEGLAATPFPADYLASARSFSPGALVPSAAALHVNQRLLREWIGLAAYRLAGRI